MLGGNSYGQLGDGTNDDAMVPVTVSDIDTALAVSAGAHHTCALLPDETVQCWGDNHRGELGADTGFDLFSLTPVAVDSLAGVTAITTQGATNCARLTDGTVRCWGQNWYGELGQGSNQGPEGCILGSPYILSYPCSRTPVTVPGISDAVAISGTCALLAGGDALCWGPNDVGQLGHGVTTGPELCKLTLMTNIPTQQGFDQYCSPTPVEVVAASAAASSGAATTSRWHRSRTVGWRAV